MKKILLYILFFIGGFEGFGQNAGVTVITHGFDGSNGGGIGEWIEHGYEVLERYNSINPTGARATVFVNDRVTNLWRIDSDSRNGIGDPNAEIIFIFDWTQYSNNLTNNRWLESSADLLFTLLVQPTKINGNAIYGTNIPGELLAQKETHFIGHSRGAILMIQVLHRLKAFFPAITIEQFTTLDPHPASRMRDVLNSVDLTTSLPGIVGNAFNCLTYTCNGGVYSNSNTSGVTISIPENVIKSDNYFRAERTNAGDIYEPAITFSGSSFSVASFSGVPSLNASFNRELNNVALTNGALSVFGGAHSAVHQWYFYSLKKISSLPTACYDNLPSKVLQYNWFSASTAPFLNHSPLTNPTGEGCFNTGYYYSRLGGGYSHSTFNAVSNKINLSGLNFQLSSRLGLISSSSSFPETVINGNFTSNFGAAKGGWFKSESFSTEGSNEILIGVSQNLPYLGNLSDNLQTTINHNKIYLANGFLKVKVSGNNSRNPSIVLKVKDNANVLVKTIAYEIINGQTQELIFDLREYKNKVISFSLNRTDSPNVGETIYIHSVTTTDQMPVSSPPTELIGYKVQKNVQLAWQNSSNDGLGYSIERALSPTGLFTQIGVVGPNQSSFVDVAPPPTILYYYKVRKLNSSTYTNFVAPTERPPGITVLTHGFSLFGNLDVDWKENANALRKRLSSELGNEKGATILVNNRLTSQWEIEEISTGNGVCDLSEELIFVYDWGISSNNSEPGYLEASADNLFAMLANPVVRLSNGGTLNLSPVSGNLISNTHTHFIGHSRGTILMLQLLHRFQKYLPNFNVERLTLLDPHPAGVMGDVKRKNIAGTPENLPGVFGYADNCTNGILALCELGNNIIKLKVPDNVVLAEGFYRQATTYEPSGGTSYQITPFSGVPVEGIGTNSYFMDDLTLTILDPAPGIYDTPHTNVHKWYFATVDPTAPIPSNLINTRNWFTTDVGSFMAGESRFTIGYNKIPTLPNQKLSINQMDNQLNTRTGRTNGLNTIFGGDLLFGSLAGWKHTNGSTQEPVFDQANNSLVLNLGITRPTITHNYMYFPPNFTSIAMEVKLDFGNYSGSVLPELLIEFFNTNGQKIKTSTKKIPLNTTSFSTFHLGFPSELQGKTGTFRISVSNEIVLTSGNPQLFKMYIKNVELGNNSIAVPPPVITASQTNIQGGQSLVLSSTGCTNGMVHWTTSQIGQSIIISPIETSGYTAFCELDGYYSTPSNAVVINVNYTHKLSSAEYFFDNEPGYGNGTPLNINNSSIINQTFNINLIPHNLTEGTHTFNIRIKDSNNRWSLTHTKPFLILGKASITGQKGIETVEYFIDFLKDDYSNLVSINVTPDGDNIAIDLPMNLPMGIHSISFRVKDSEGKISIFHTKTFLVIGQGNGTGKIAKVEYFIDNDLGFDKGTQIPYTATPMSFNIDLSNYTQGVHVVYVRVKMDNGAWSLTHAKTFMIIPNTGQNTIDKIEYFLDNTDPGEGNAINVSFIPNSEGGVTANFDLATTQLTTGVHKISVRARGQNGIWSPIRNSNFELTQPSCTAMTTIKSGNWNDPSVWSCNRVPISTDNITISTGHTINVPTGNYQVNSISTLTGSNLSYQTGAVILIFGN